MLQKNPSKYLQAMEKFQSLINVGHEQNVQSYVTKKTSKFNKRRAWKNFLTIEYAI